MGTLPEKKVVVYFTPSCPLLSFNVKRAICFVLLAQAGSDKIRQGVQTQTSVERSGRKASLNFER